MASKPIFVLLHGAWHTPKCWTKLVALLNQAGYRAVAPTLPSSGPNAPTPDWSSDVAVIWETLGALVDQGDDVVVVMHSFGGIAGGTALDGLDRASRKAIGLPGGVVRLVYIVGNLVPEGFRHLPEGTRDNMVPEMNLKTDLEAGVITVAPGDAKDMFYQDLDDATVAELAKDLIPQSFASYRITTTHAAWRYIPTTYVLCMHDKPSNVVAAQSLLDSAKASGPHKIDNIIKVDAGHSPFISKPEWTAEMLIEEAGKIEA